MYESPGPPPVVDVVGDGATVVVGLMFCDGPPVDEVLLVGDSGEAALVVVDDVGLVDALVDVGDVGLVDAPVDVL